MKEPPSLSKEPELRLTAQESVPVTVDVISPKNSKSSELNMEQFKKLNDIEYEKMKLKLINSLTNFANLEETSKNVFVNRKENRVRKFY